jgi:NAD(P)-dependent dehydrogenase (short-subunit alcohol dehydrogenase family)
VVTEITSAGGQAVANYDSIATPEGGRSIVACALDTFGRVDVVVNNAGQVRMAPFEDFPEESIDALINTQLRGTLNVSRPAWKWMKAHGGGRIVNVSSGAAFGGVPNGSVYAMTKMGVIGLTRGMASEGAPLGIACNVVVPYAKTRLGTSFGPIPWSPELGEWLSPSLVAPLVVWLSHSECPLNGETLSVGAGWQAGMNISVAAGYSDRDCTVESIQENIETLMGAPHSPVTAFASSAIKNLLGGFRIPKSEM